MGPWVATDVQIFFSVGKKQQINLKFIYYIIEAMSNILVLLKLFIPNTMCECACVCVRERELCLWQRATVP